MAEFGELEFPDELLDRDYALGLLSEYLERDVEGYVYSGAAFDTYARGPVSGQPGTRATEIAPAVHAVTDSDVVALSLLSTRITGYQALSITGPLADRIGDLLAQIPPQARIQDEDSDLLLARPGPHGSCGNCSVMSPTAGRASSSEPWRPASCWPANAPT